MSGNYERENSINWCNRQHTVSFELNQLKLKNQIRKLVEEGDEDVKITHEGEDGTMIGSMPLEYLKISKPHKRNLTAAQRQAVAERFHGKNTKVEG